MPVNSWIYIAPNLRKSEGLSVLVNFVTSTRTTFVTRKVSVRTTTINATKSVSYAAFTQTGLTTRYRTKSLNKSIFELSRSRDISFIKRIKVFLSCQGHVIYHL